jgi:acyl-CoA thioesterase I
VSITVVALGDSLTQGWMVSKGYIDFLKEMLRAEFPQSRFKLVNSGIPGDTADSGLYRLSYDVLNHKPDCVFVQYALNDAFSGFTEQQFKKNIRGIIEKINENSNAEIILVTSGYIGDNDENQHVERYYHQLKALGEEYSIPVVAVHEYWKKKVNDGVPFESLVQYDGVHPTEDGYRLMSEAVMELFV